MSAARRCGAPRRCRSRPCRPAYRRAGRLGMAASSLSSAAPAPFPPPPIRASRLQLGDFVLQRLRDGLRPCAPSRRRSPSTRRFAAPAPSAIRGSRRAGGRRARAATRRAGGSERRASPSSKAAGFSRIALISCMDHPKDRNQRRSSRSPKTLKPRPAITRRAPQSSNGPRGSPKTAEPATMPTIGTSSANGATVAAE